MKLQDWLEASTVGDVLRSKSSQHSSIQALPCSSSIKSVMHFLGSNDISAITLFEDKCCSQTAGCHWRQSTREYTHLLTVRDLLKHLCKLIDDLTVKDPVDVHALLDVMAKPVMDILCYAKIAKPVFVSENVQLSVIMNKWAKDMHSDFSAHRVLIGSEKEIKGLITMADVLHYIFVNQHQLRDYLLVPALPALYPGTKTPSPIQESHLVTDDDTALAALQKLAYGQNANAIGITDSISGLLLGSLSPMDFLPTSEDPKDMECILGSLHQPVSIFTKACCNFPTTRHIDAVTIREQMMLVELIERLQKLRVHMLWRLSFTGHVIGMVTVHDVIKYLITCAKHED